MKKKQMNKQSRHCGKDACKNNEAMKRLKGSKSKVLMGDVSAEIVFEEDKDTRHSTDMRDNQMRRNCDDVSQENARKEQDHRTTVWIVLDAKIG